MQRPTEEILLVGRDRDGEIHVVDLGMLSLTLMHVASKSYEPGVWMRTKDRVDEEGRPLFVHASMIQPEDMHPVLRRML